MYFPYLIPFIVVYFYYVYSVVSTNYKIWKHNNSIMVNVTGKAVLSASGKRDLAICKCLTILAIILIVESFFIGIRFK